MSSEITYPYLTSPTPYRSVIPLRKGTEPNVVVSRLQYAQECVLGICNISDMIETRPRHKFFQIVLCLHDPQEKRVHHENEKINLIGDASTRTQPAFVGQDCQTLFVSSLEQPLETVVRFGDTYIQQSIPTELPMTAESGDDRTLSPSFEQELCRW